MSATLELPVITPGRDRAPAEDPLDLMDEIDRLKVEKDATILAHYYVDGEIQDIADFTGDSLKLARDATQVDDLDDRLLRRPLHGRVRQDHEPGEAGADARPAGRLLARRKLPAGEAARLPGEAAGGRAAISSPWPTSTRPRR